MKIFTKIHFNRNIFVSKKKKFFFLMEKIFTA